MKIRALQDYFRLIQTIKKYLIIYKKKKFEHEFLKKIVSYKNIIIFDYNMDILIQNLQAKFNKLKKNFFINYQTNSYNFWFQLIHKI